MSYYSPLLAWLEQKGPYLRGRPAFHVARKYAQSQGQRRPDIKMWEALNSLREQGMVEQDCWALTVPSDWADSFLEEPEENPDS